MRNFLRSPYRNIVLAVTLAFILLIFRLNQVEGGLASSFDWFFLDGLLCGLGFLFWLLFFSQFLVPLRNLNERREIFQRLRLYISGRHGPAVFVSDGKAIQRKDEIKQEGAGLILLDSASAAVLRRNDRFTRAIGPGVVFTVKNEYLEGDKAVVDLRPQKQTIGPSLTQDGQQVIVNSDDQARQEVQNRERMETRALTRDGIEIVPVITVFFKIDADPGTGGSEFGYNASAVERAIIGRNIDANLPSDTPDRIHDWRWLPAYLAADVWKENVSKFTLDELFTTLPDRIPALLTVLENIENRLIQPNAPALDAFGRPTPQQIDSQEYRLLRERGIRVQRVEVRSLEMPAGVEKHLIQHWKASWLNQARKETSAVDQLRTAVVNDANTQAREYYLLETARRLANAASNGQNTCAALLAELVSANIRMIENNEELLREMQAELRELYELRAMLLNEGGPE